jgi:hypothetical protein
MLTPGAVSRAEGTTMRAPWLLALALGIGCGGQAPAEPAPPAPEAPPAAAAPGADEHVHPTPSAAAPPLELPAVPAGARVLFVAPKDGEKIVGPLENGKVTVALKMGAEGITVQPAGPVAAGSGHHHVLIDVEPVAKGTVVPKDEQHVHFGQGQTEATLALAPGPHTLQLQFADGIHRSYGPELSAKIAISVGAAGSVDALPVGEPPKPTLP